MDDSYSRGTKDENKIILDELKKFDPKLKFTKETEPTKFLDTKIKLQDHTLITEVYRKKGSLPNHWKSVEPKRYKRNTILCDLHRALKISSNFEKEVKIIKEKFIKAGYPGKFIDSVINQFTEENIESVIPTNLFEEEDKRPLCRVKIPYCPKNENLAQGFLSKLDRLCPKVKFFIIWNTTKLKSCFPVKDKITHKCSVIYKGVCSCGSQYIGETARCEHVRFEEHNNPKGISEPSKHLKAENTKKRGRPRKDALVHKFEWSSLCRAPTDYKKRKIMEGLVIAKSKPNLNQQVNCHKMILFKEGIT